jgi:hypothetical protein
MAALRFIALIALALWVGGLAVLASVSAPVLFEVLVAQDPASGPEMAGRIFGVMFGRFQYVSWGLAALVVLSLGARAALGPRPRRFGLRTWSVLAMLVASLATVLVITPRIDRIRTSVAGSITALGSEDPRRRDFGRLHGLSTGLMIATLLIGAGLLWMETRDQP